MTRRSLLSRLASLAAVPAVPVGAVPVWCAGEGWSGHVPGWEEGPHFLNDVLGPSMGGLYESFDAIDINNLEEWSKAAICWESGIPLSWRWSKALSGNGNALHFSPPGPVTFSKEGGRFYAKLT